MESSTVELMETTKPDQVLQAVHDTAVQCGALKAILFGSFARQTATRHSDVDAVFVENTNRRFIERLGRYMDGIYERLGIPAEVFVYTPAEFDAMADQPFMKRVLREGIVAYER
jgi:predicted nucleotidyltransferase